MVECFFLDRFLNRIVFFESMLQIGHGAEAILYKDGSQVMKERLAKAYRLPALDESLRKFRTRREAKVLGKLQEMGFPSPHLRDFSDKRMSILMDFVPGVKLKDVLEQREQVLDLGREMGQRIAKLHSANIIHGDLTTSNMILHETLKEIHFIDFGLSFFSEKVEDKAVDLFLLQKGLETSHATQFEEMFPELISSYQEAYGEGVKEVLDRLEKVRMRGRNKGKE